jgi:RimJ/RimL family protein N-acetyltransferase
VDTGIEKTILRGEVKDLQICAGRFRGERRRNARDAFRDLTHVDEDEYPGDLGARPHQRIGEAFDCLAIPDRIICKQNSPTPDVCASARADADRQPVPPAEAGRTTEVAIGMKATKMGDMESLVIRPLSPEDRDLLADLPSRVSPPSAISRFHGAVSDLSEALLDRLLDLEIGHREAFIATADGTIVGVARYARDEETGTAEVAVLVADEWQHHGVGQALMSPLIAQAKAAGIGAFRADMLTGNLAARHLIETVGPVLKEQVAGGHVVLTVELD